MSEELALEESLGDRGAVDRDERRAAPRGERVDGPREELLARSALPLEQDRRVRGGDPLGLGSDGADRRRVADDRREEARLRLREEQRLTGPAAPLDATSDHQPQEVGVDGLRDEVLGAVLHGLDRGLDRAERRHHEDRERGVGFDRGVEDREAVRARQLPVGEHQVEALARAELLHGLGPGLDAGDVEALRLEHLLEHRAQRALVLDDQDARHDVILDFRFWILDWKRKTGEGRFDSERGEIRGWRPRPDSERRSSAASLPSRAGRAWGRPRWARSGPLPASCRRPGS